MSRKDTPVVVMGSKEKGIFQLKVGSLTALTHARSMTQRIEVEIIVAPEQYSDLTGQIVQAYFNRNETIDIETKKYGRINLRQSGYHFLNNSEPIPT